MYCMAAFKDLKRKRRKKIRVNFHSLLLISNILTLRVHSIAYPKFMTVTIQPESWPGKTKMRKKITCFFPLQRRERNLLFYVLRV